jgi:predicted dithiol-disulfide oxidoreductase (DUF899 family)
VSRAPYATLRAYRERMGWSVPWYSSSGSDFNVDFHVSFSLTALGRQEDWEEPAGRSDGPFMSWLRRHDEY